MNKKEVPEEWSAMIEDPSSSMRRYDNTWSHRRTLMWILLVGISTILAGVAFSFRNRFGIHLFWGEQDAFVSSQPYYLTQPPSFFQDVALVSPTLFQMI